MINLPKFFLILILIVSWQPSSADFDLKKWEFKSRVNTENLSGEYLALDLPSIIFEKLNKDLSDLRIISNDEEVPYVAMTADEKKFSIDLPSKMYDLSTVLGQHTSFTVDLGESGLLHSRVTIETPSENFKRKITVYGGDEVANLKLLNDRGQIFDFTDKESKPTNVRINSVNYPESTSRFLKIVIDDSGEAPLNITGAKIVREVKENAREIDYNPTIEVSENRDTETTDVIADLGFAGAPHNSGEISTANDIFSRGLQIYESEDGKSWSALGSGYIFSIDTPKFVGKNLKFSYPESKKRYLKIVVLNKDDKPIKIDGVKLKGTVRSIIFAYSPGKIYHLYLGNKDSKRPEYDIKKIGAYLDETKLDKATLGAIEENEQFVRPKLKPTEEFPELLTGFLVFIVLILFGLIIKLFFSLKKR